MQTLTEMKKKLFGNYEVS